ncbi:Cold shock-like protein CspC [Defluviimonas aquaemixtae]|uniref:Cold shock-like protein CspC n=1 Tax=Albidovulum aquaemixtae TaxID=1542388 RepID=A0A2R8B4Y0_9RHOB|nr:HPF/RaiA family ribosome-associated protein [Defluviimonas aquaemixtae]SPH17686.1 Cold shock-like protein CspC [Defluviimonas aquaemixtae]
METEPQIIFHGMDASPAVTSEIRGKIGKLEQVFQRITSCRVIVEKRTARGHKGHLYQVAVEAEVPGGVIVVNKKPGDLAAHEDLHVAIRDSFNAARRQLDDYVRKMKGVQVKSHPEKHHGQVVRLFTVEGYGFIRSSGGLEVYFQRDSVIGSDWERLDLGTDLEFSLMDGEKGPFAVNVSLRS